MSSLFCCYGGGDVNKTYSNTKFNVTYVVSLCGFSLNALQPKLWNIKQEGELPWKMVAASLSQLVTERSLKILGAALDGLLEVIGLK